MNAVGTKDSTYTLLVPYNYSDPVEDFNNNGKDIDSLEYAQLLVKTYNKYKYGIDETMRSSFGKNISINSFPKEKVVVKQQGYYFEDIKVNLYTTQNQEPTIDYLINLYQTKEPFVLLINMYRLGDVEHADLEIEMRGWAKECVKINRIPNMDPLTKIKSLSKKSMKIKFDDSKSSAILQNCKMIEYINNRKFAFLIDKIIFVTE